MEILCDTGAAFDCMSETYYKRFFSHTPIDTTSNKRAYDASDNPIRVRGECCLGLKLRSQNRILQIDQVRFTILVDLSHDIIIGCPTLAMLGFAITDKYAILKNMEFERLINKKPRICHLKIVIELEVRETLVVSGPTGEECTVCAIEPGQDQITNVRPGMYPASLEVGVLTKELDEPHKIISGQVIDASIRVLQRELEPLWVLVIHGRLDQMPTQLLCTWGADPIARGTKSFINNVKHESSRPKLSNHDLKNMLKNSELPEHQTEELLKRFACIFAINEEDLGSYTHPVQLKLRDPTADPSYAKPRVVPYRLRPWLDEKLKSMMDCGLIEVAKNSPFCAPIHIVKKKEKNKYRLTIDYRKLNEMLVQNRFPIPNIRTVLEELSGSRFYSVADCRSGFWQLRLEETSKNMTSFAARGRLYRWRVLPMGLSPSPGIFQSVMMEVLGDLIFKCCVVYIDDIIVYTKTAEEHVQVLEKIFMRLWDAGIRLHPEKSHFGLAEVDFLGYTVGSEGYIPIPSKVQDILDMPPPDSKTSLKSFIGSCAYYTTSLPMLQFVLGPLHEISGSKAKFEWTAKQEDAYQQVKEILASCGPLAFPDKDGKAPMYLTTDASDIGYGGVLSETGENGAERPLGYFSGSFRNSSLNWPILEKELYSLYHGLCYFYPQLMEKVFVWRTDNRALSTLTSNINLKVKPNGMPNSRVCRWIEFICQFDFSIELLKGTAPGMGLADCLSRFRTKDRNKVDSSTAITVITNDLIRLPYWTQTGCALVEFIAAQRRDKHLINKTGVWRRWTKGKRTAKFRINDDGVYEIKVKTGPYRAMVPRTLIRSVLDFHHLKSHQSARNMIPAIKKSLFVPRLQAHIRSYIQGCTKCLSVFNRPSTKRQPIKTSTATHPWATVQADLTGPLPTSLNKKKYILGVVCEATNWLELRSLPDKTAESVLEGVNSVFQTRGPCINFQTDGGAEFVNSTLDAYLADLGIVHNRITPYKPTSNGRIEGAMKKIGQQLKLLEVPSLTWDAGLPWVQLAINWSKQVSGYSAWQLFHGWVLYRPAYLQGEFDAAEQQKYLESEDQWAREQVIRMAHLISDVYRNKEAKKLVEFESKSPPEESLKLGMKVLVYFPALPKSKLFSQWKHIYIIKEILDKNCFVVEEENQKRKRYLVDRRRIRPIKTSMSFDDLAEIDLEETSDSETANVSEANQIMLATIPEDPNEDLGTNDADHEVIIPSEEPVLEKTSGVHFEEPEIEFTVPEVDEPEDERPRRKAAAKAMKKIKGWTDQLLKP